MTTAGGSLVDKHLWIATAAAPNNQRQAFRQRLEQSENSRAFLAAPVQLGHTSGLAQMHHRLIEELGKIQASHSAGLCIDVEQLDLHIHRNAICVDSLRSQR